MAVEERRGSAIARRRRDRHRHPRLAGAGPLDFFLNGPLHVGTTLWALVAFLGSQARRFGRGFALAVVFLAAGLLGDLQMLPSAYPRSSSRVLPPWKRRDWRAGLAQLTARSPRRHLLAEVIRRIVGRSGPSRSRRPTRSRPLSDGGSNLKPGVHEGVALMGVGELVLGTRSRSESAQLRSRACSGDRLPQRWPAPSSAYFGARCKVGHRSSAPAQKPLGAWTTCWLSARWARAWPS